MRRSLAALRSSGRWYSDALDPSSGAAHLLFTCKHCPAVFAGFSRSFSCCSAPQRFPRWRRCLPNRRQPGQLPSPTQIQQTLQQQPELARRLREKIGMSGLTDDQIRARLRAAGYPESLLDQYLPSATDTSNVTNPTGNILDRRPPTGHRGRSGGRIVARTHRLSTATGGFAAWGTPLLQRTPDSGCSEWTSSSAPPTCFSPL